MERNSLNNEVWGLIAWEDLEDHILRHLTEQLLAHLGLILAEKLASVSLIVENGPSDQFKLVIQKSRLDDPMIVYLRTQSESLRHKVMVIAEFEKSIAAGALGRFEPEMRVALSKHIREKDDLQERLIKNLTIVCSEIYQWVELNSDLED